MVFALGIVFGSVGQDWLLWVLYNVPEGPTHLFLTGPISCLAIGLALVPGARLLPWLLPDGLDSSWAPCCRWRSC